MLQLLLTAVFKEMDLALGGPHMNAKVGDVGVLAFQSCSLHAM